MTKEELLKGESDNVEFKVQRPTDSSKYMKSVVAFANGKGGSLIFGIDDKSHEVVGIPKENIFREMDAITEAISDSCEPAIIPDIYLQTIDDKSIIVVEVSAGRQRPYYLKSKGITDGVYIRVAGTTRHADRDMTTEMYYEDEGRSFDTAARKDLTVSDEEINALCNSMKEVAVKNAGSETAKQAVRDVTKNQLLSWGLLAETEDGEIHPTNGYIYLTGQDPFYSMIQCGMFKGKTRAVFVDKREYTGPLWKQVEDAFQFVLRNIHLGSRLNGIYREDIYELPPDSIREVIINAVMNCSFLSSSHIQVAIYDDRLEITSPGGLMPGVTIDRMKEGFSKIRNKALAHAFLYMNMIEEWGSGVPKLIREMQEQELREPEFIDMESAFRVNLYRAVLEENLETGANDTANHDAADADGVNDTNKSDADGVNDTNKSGADGANGVNKSGVDDANDAESDRDYSENAEMLLDLIRGNSKATIKQLSRESGLSERTVDRLIAVLKNQKKLERVGNSRSGYWKVL